MDFLIVTLTNIKQSSILKKQTFKSNIISYFFQKFLIRSLFMHKNKTMEFRKSVIALMNLRTI